MLRKLDSNNMGNSNLGWLQSKFHFSFAEYYNPKNIHFGALRVINDDLIAPHTGFTTHPHQNMEIISYVVNGHLSHGDSMGNDNTITRGQVQYMSAGTGVLHSEMNNGDDQVRLLQIWILPDRNGHTPNYGDYRFNYEDRHNQWNHMVSSKVGNAPIKINQDANIYSLELDKDKEMTFDVQEGRQAYLVQIEGKSTINMIQMDARDGMEIVEENITIKANEDSHFLIIEMNKQ